MRSISSCPVPANTLLDGHRQAGAYTDCFVTSIAATACLAQYVAAFYTTPLFKLERLILGLAVAKPSTDVQAAEVAEGSRDDFAAWRVEGRKVNELLMCDIYGRTRSWMMVLSAVSVDGVARTQLYFGSAVVPARRSVSRRPGLGFPFNAFLGFHLVYSRLLLRAAASRLLSQLDRRDIVQSGSSR